MYKIDPSDFEQIRNIDEDIVGGSHVEEDAQLDDWVFDDGGCWCDCYTIESWYRDAMEEGDDEAADKWVTVVLELERLNYLGEGEHDDLMGEVKDLPDRKTKSRL